MSGQEIPRAEQLPLREVLWQASKQKLELAAGLAIGVVVGAIEGGKNGYYAIQSEHFDAAHKFDELEDYANDQHQHDD